MKRLLARLLSFFSGGAQDDAPMPPDQVPVPDMALPELDAVMTLAQFWEIIRVVHEASGGDPDIKEAALRKALESFPATQVAHFAWHFDAREAEAYRWDLWAAAYIIHGGCSDDSFQDFRASLICWGRACFEGAMADPDSLAAIEFDDVEETLFFEGYQYLPRKIYEQKTGGDLTPSGVEHPCDPIGDEWAEEDLQKVCPKLWAKYD